MVDPNRKINRLSDNDAAFLVECEHEFRHRYTQEDKEFAAFSAKPNRPPPIVEPWKANRRHQDDGKNFNRNRNYNRNQDMNRPFQPHYNNRPYNNRQYNGPHNRSYDRPYGREGGGGHGSSHPY